MYMELWSLRLRLGNISMLPNVPRIWFPHLTRDNMEHLKSKLQNLPASVSVRHATQTLPLTTAVPQLGRQRNRPSTPTPTHSSSGHTSHQIWLHNIPSPTICALEGLHMSRNTVKNLRNIRHGYKWVKAGEILTPRMGSEDESEGGGDGFLSSN
jgi:hypothetical protein